MQVKTNHSHLVPLLHQKYVAQLNLALVLVVPTCMNDEHW